MFEFGIFCVIALAIGYWATLWLMGRRDDVLHGDFVQTDAQPEGAANPLSSAASADRLQALLTRIKQDLKDAARI